MAAKRKFGSVRQRKSGRWQARYTGPDGHDYTARTDDGRSLTFDTEGYAEAWLARVWADIQRGVWKPPGLSSTTRGVMVMLESGSDGAPVIQTLREYAQAWMASRRTAAGQPLSPGTIRIYNQILKDHILPPMGGSTLGLITPAVVRDWYAKLDTGPRQQAAAYSLLSTILGTAVADEILTSNPCRIHGGGQWQRQREIVPATLEELAAIAAAMPKRYQLLVLLAGWCGLRFGELTELRRWDIDVQHGLVHVRRGVVRGQTGSVVKSPKTRAGTRTVHIPPHLMPAVKDHLRDHVGGGHAALVFPSKTGGHLATSSLQWMYGPARDKAGRPDLRFHDLRHTQAVLAAATGATLAELMARLGHSTASMAMRYQHAAADRDKAIAEALSKMATVTPISAARGKRKRTASSG